MFEPNQKKTNNRALDKFQNSLFAFGLLNLLWIIFRTGAKPSRIVYPCQKAAIKNVSISFSSLLGVLSVATIYTQIRTLISDYKILSSIFFLGTILSSSTVIYSTFIPKEISLTIQSTQIESDPLSEIFLVNGPEIAHISNLIDLMGENGLLFFQSSTLGTNSGPTGLISDDDVVLIKNNCQWSKRGGTNTDLIKELIDLIHTHPDGFIGEIVVADNGQGRGDMDWDNANAEDISQSVQDIVDDYEIPYKVSAYLWDNIRGNEVEEYSDGDLDDGYIRYNTPDPESYIYVTYPKFETKHGTKISFKHGIWNGTDYENRLKIINFPVLKSHGSFGVTATVKHYMGVQSQAIGNGHSTIATGSMGTLMVELGLPTLNIIDSIWINAIPKNGPATSYSEATRVNILLAGLDPIAMDYWVAKHILIPVAEDLGYTDLHTFNPDSTDRSGLTEAFGTWLNHSKAELERAGYNVTNNENEIGIIANSLDFQYESVPKNYWWIYVASVGGVLSIAAILLIVFRKKIFKK